MPTEVNPKYLNIIIELFNQKGIFSFSTQGKYKYKVPYFCIKSKNPEVYFLKLVKRELGIKSKIYTYKESIGKDGYIRSGFSMLIVRNIGELKDSVIPFAAKFLTGEKLRKFRSWMNDMGTIEMVPSGYKQIPVIVKTKNSV
jgi:hypothetical protein